MNGHIAVLFNYPLLTLFNQPAFAGGIALLYVYTAWALLIALLVRAIENK